MKRLLFLALCFNLVASTFQQKRRKKRRRMMTKMSVRRTASGDCSDIEDDGDGDVDCDDLDVKIDQLAMILSSRWKKILP